MADISQFSVSSKANNCRMKIYKVIQSLPYSWRAYIFVEVVIVGEPEAGYRCRDVPEVALNVRNRKRKVNLESNLSF